MEQVKVEGRRLVIEEVPISEKADAAVDALYFNMEEDGYKAGAPEPDDRNIEEETIEELDRFVIEGGEKDGRKWPPMKCTRWMCEGGMTYHPFHKPGSYRAFSVCPVCGDVREF